MRLGFYGGSFNPPHLGHYNVAKNIIDILCLDGLYIAPAGYQYFKNQNNVASKEDRQQMCSTFLSRIDNTAVYTGELERDGPTHTIESIEDVKKKNPFDDIYLIMGLDVFEWDFYKWYKVSELIDMVTVIVVNRSYNSDVAYYETAKFRLETQLNKKIKSLYVELPQIIDANLKETETIDMLSSSKIRELIKAGEPYEYLLTPEIANYIKYHHLYGA